MSHFTSVKIKINENEHLGTLLAEYGGDFEVKVWILDSNEAWTGELSTVEAQTFISNYKIPKEVFLEELQRALTTSDPVVLYSLDKHEEKGHILSWKKCLDSGAIIKNGEITLEKVSRKDVYEEVIERSFEHNAQLQSQIEGLKKDKQNLLNEKEKVMIQFEKVVCQKESFEKNVYSQFLSVLNAKKERIAELQDITDQLTSTQSKGTSSKETNPNAGQREVLTREEPKRQRRNERNAQKKKEETKTEEVDPFEVDTDVEDDDIPDVPTPRLSKRNSTDVQSQSFSMDSFDEVSSPVAVLPKRSKLNPKEKVKKAIRSSPEKPSEKVAETEEDLLDQL